MEAKRVLRAMFHDGSAASSLPPELEQRAADRLRWLVLVVALVFAATIPLRFLTWGKSDGLVTLSDVVAGTFAGLSLIAFVALRFGDFPAAIVLKLGLIYEIGLCFALALVEQVRIGFSTMPFRLSVVSVVLLTFPLAVPTPPRWRVIATAIGASSVPAAIALVHLAHGELDPFEIIGTSAPTMLVAGLAAWLATIVHRLRIDASRALTFGHYELVRKLGEGGMGEVWEARHANLLRPAAIKLIKSEMAGVHGASARARFKREAQATGALSSPHTVELFDFGTTDDGTLYYAMELLEGVDLETLIRRFGPMSPARVLHVLDQTARSLGEAHELGLVHRDIKPANIVLCRVGSELDFVKVLDFGLVKPLYVGDGSPVSIAGAVSGTPGYVAPEHASARPLDGRADLYSLGCVAYFLLTARRVFDRPNKMAMLAAHLSEDPVPPSVRSGLPIPQEIDALVLSLLARDPEGRPASARALLARVAAIESALGLRWADADAEAWWQANMPDAVRPRTALIL